MYLLNDEKLFGRAHCAVDVHQPMAQPLLTLHRRIITAVHLVGLARGASFGCGQFNELFSVLPCALNLKVVQLAQQVVPGFRVAIPRAIAIGLAAAGL